MGQVVGRGRSGSLPSREHHRPSSDSYHADIVFAPSTCRSIRRISLINGSGWLTLTAMGASPARRLSRSSSVHAFLKILSSRQEHWRFLSSKA